MLAEVVAAAFILPIVLYFAFRNTPSHRGNVERFFRGFRIGGHRGSPMMAPENTIASMKQAQSEGADLVEFDVSLTQDGVPVLLHDDTLDRTTNLSGTIREKQYKDIQHTCNAAAKFRRSGASNVYQVVEPLSTVEELVQWAKANQMKMLFDVKDSDQSLVLKLDELFTRYDLYDSAIVCSFFPSVVYRVKRHNPRILTGITWRRWFCAYQDLECKSPRFSGVSHYVALLLDILNVWSIHSWLPGFLGVDMVLTEHSEISAEFVRRQRCSGRQVCAWTVNDLNEINWMRNTLDIPLLTDKPFLVSTTADAA